jgi:predicted nucleotidyltransferase
VVFVAQNKFRDRNYLLDQHGNILKIVGDDHDDFVVSYVKYFPSHAGKKIFGGEKYAVNTQVYNSFYLLSEFPDTIKYSYAHGNCVTGCKKENVVRVFDAKERLQEILEFKDEFRARSAPSKSLVNVLECLDANGIDLSNLGVTGSFLTGMDDSASDIDLVCYGRNAAKSIFDIVNGSTEFQKYEGALFQDLINRRITHMPSVSVEALRKQEARKIQAVFQGCHFNVQPLRGESDYDAQKGAVASYVDLGETSLLARVIDDADSIYAPAFYGVDCVEILDGVKNRNIESKLTQIISFIGAYSQIIKRGERIHAKGTLLRCEKEGEVSYAVSIDPWNRGFDNKIQLVN